MTLLRRRFRSAGKGKKKKKKKKRDGTPTYQTPTRGGKYCALPEVRKEKKNGEEEIGKVSHVFKPVPHLTADEKGLLGVKKDEKRDVAKSVLN